MTLDTGQCHRTLLGFAGQAPDEVVTGLREWLAEGRAEEVTRTVAEAALKPLNHVFAPVLPDGANPPPTLLDLTDGGVEDAPDVAAVGVASAAAGSVGLWRAWRAPNAVTSPRPVRVYLLETTADAQQWPGITAAMQEALSAAGVEHPQVEVYGPDVALPAYQRLARGRSALLWAAGPAGTVTIARVFDSADPIAGPRFDAGHAVLPAGPDRDRILAYLRGGFVLMATTARSPDVVEPRRGGVVPMSFRTDGVWIWTDTVAYYLDTYGLSPDPELLAHIGTAAGPGPAVDSVAVHRAMMELFAPQPVA